MFSEISDNRDIREQAGPPATMLGNRRLVPLLISGDLPANMDNLLGTAQPASGKEAEETISAVLRFHFQRHMRMK